MNGVAFRTAGSAITPASATNCWPNEGAVQWPLPEGSAPQPTRGSTRTAISNTPTAARNLICAEWAPFPEQPNGEYPFVLNTGRTVEHWHTRTKTREVPILERLSPRAWLEMNPRDAKRLGLRSHDPVDVVSRRGRTQRSRIAAYRNHCSGPGLHALPFLLKPT